jgi:uncharacterized protein (TIGR00251 family)
VSEAWYCWQDGALILHIRVQPGSTRDEIAGTQGNQLKVRLRAPPVDGKANASLIRLLADLCGVAKRDVEIISGIAGRDKRVCIYAPGSLPHGVKTVARHPP